MYRRNMLITIGILFLVGTALIVIAPGEEKTRTKEVIKYRPVHKTDVLEAIADATVSPSQGSNETELKVGRLYGIGWITYVMFDLSDIPTNATIEAMELKLKSKVFIAEGNRWIRAADSSVEWTENEINWDTKPERYKRLDTQWIELMEEWYSWDCTNAPLHEGKLSIALELLEGMDGYVIFYSRETEYKPQLKVEYTFEEPYTDIVTETYVEINPISGAGAFLIIIAIILFPIWIIMYWRHRRRLIEKI